MATLLMRRKVNIQEVEYRTYKIRATLSDKHVTVASIEEEVDLSLVGQVVQRLQQEAIKFETEGEEELCEEEDETVYSEPEGKPKRQLFRSVVKDDI